MKLTGLFKRKTGEPDKVVSEKELQDSLTKLWQKQPKSEIFTADQARKLASDRTNYSYLDVNVISKILETVQRAACRHQTSVSGSIGGIRLAQEEIDYCITLLSNAGYSNIMIFNVSNPNVYPESVEYKLSW